MAADRPGTDTGPARDLCHRHGESFGGERLRCHLENALAIALGISTHEGPSDNSSKRDRCSYHRTSQPRTHRESRATSATASSHGTRQLTPAQASVDLRLPSAYRSGTGLWRIRGRSHHEVP